MRPGQILLCLAISLPLPISTPLALGQSTDASLDKAPLAATAATPVPALIPYSGILAGGDAKAASGPMAMTFLIFKDEQGGEPLWTESQTVAVDEQRHFHVQLGTTLANGLPGNLFTSGEARWLEVQIAGLPPQRRVLLLSVPYALKAADAATLGGLPASAFALAGSAGATQISSTQTGSGPGPEARVSNVTTPGGMPGFLPVFSGAATISDSTVFQSGTRLGINIRTPASTLDVNGTATLRGAVNLPPTAAATAVAGKKSVPLAFSASSYNSAKRAAAAPLFSFQAEPFENNTAAPGATLNLLYGNGAAPAETGLSISSRGILTFASGQTFPGAGKGEGTISGVTAGTGLLGGGIKGNVTLSLDRSVIPTLSGNPVFNSSTSAVTGNTTGAYYDTAGILGTAGQRSNFGAGGIAGIWGDASAHVGVLGTSTAFAGVQGLSSTGPGIQGFSSTNDGIEGNTTGTTVNTAGVHGIAQGGTGFGGLRAGVWGESNSYVGVFGSSTVAPGVQGRSGSGAGIQGYSATGTGGVGITQGSTLNTAGLLGTAGTSTGYGGIAGVWGDAATHVGVFGSSLQYTGVYGVSTSSNGVLGQTNDTNAADDVAGVYGNSSSGLPAVKGVNSGSGFAGQFVNNSQTAAALQVINFANQNTEVYASFPVTLSAEAAGYEGISIQGNSNKGIGIRGVGGPDSNEFNRNNAGIRVGVWGDVTGDDSTHNLGVEGTASASTAGFFQNYSGTQPTVAAINGDSGGTGLFKTFEAIGHDGTCGIGDRGDLTCTGQMKTLAATGQGTRMVETYAMQSPENWMEDFGSGTLENGVATIAIDVSFAETVSDSADYHVFLTPRGDSKGLYVSHATAAAFEVHESGGGTSSLAFDYRIVARRRGFETQRMVDVTERFHAEQARFAERLHEHSIAAPKTER